MYKLFIFVSVLTYATQTNALDCFACSMAGSDTDQTCLTDPHAVPGQNIVACSKKYCTITRQESQDPKGKLVSFQRGCENSPLFINTEVEDFTFKTYFRSCSEDLCNDGDGIRNNGGTLNADGLAGENLLVKPKDRNISAQNQPMFVMTIMSSIAVILMYKFI